MKQLFLIRHAKSSWADDSLSDRERPLNARGHSQILPLGRALARAGAFDGQVFASSATRAQATLEGILPRTFPDQCLHTSPELYTFDHRRLIRWLQAREDGDTIAIIGHNPALLELAQWLLKQPPEQLPTASFIHLRLPIHQWHQLSKGKGKLTALLTPNEFSYAQFARKRKKRARPEPERPDRGVPAALTHQLWWLQQLEPGVRQGLDDEFLHQYRIAIRRSRAIAESVQEVTGSKLLARPSKQLKHLAKATSRLRDLQVWLQQLPALCAGNDELESALRTYFGREADDEHGRLIKILDSKRQQQRLADWQSLFESRKFRKLAGGLSHGDIQTAIAVRIKQFNRRTAELMHTSPDDDIHRLRKALKRIRYLMELDKASWQSSIADLKARQQLFGRFQDLHVQIALLQQFRDDAPDTLPAAIDNLEHRLEQHKADARRQTLALGGLDGAPL